MAMLTFNLALTYHADATRKGLKANAVYAKAFQLYETTKSFLLDASILRVLAVSPSTQL